MLGRYQSNLRIDHWKAIKKVLCYLQGTNDYMLTYQYCDLLELIGYCDLDFMGCVDTLKSTFGYIFLFAKGAIFWKSVKQTLIASSIMEAKFMACYEAISQVVWLKNFMVGLKIIDSVSRPITIFYDN